MTLVEAEQLLDVLVDKANNPYFTNAEKRDFLELAVTDFIEKYYTVYDINEQSRAALKGFTQNSSSTTGASVIPLSDEHIYTLAVNVQYWHTNAVAIGSTARNKSYVQAKQVSVAEFRATADPFSGPSYDNPIYTYTTSAGGVPQIDILPADSIQNKNYYFIERQDLANIFDNSRVEETYQHEIVQIAARKMLASIESPNYEIQSQEAN